MRREVLKRDHKKTDKWIEKRKWKFQKKEKQIATKHEKSSFTYYKRTANQNCTTIHILLIGLEKIQKFNTFWKGCGEIDIFLCYTLMSVYIGTLSMEGNLAFIKITKAYALSLSNFTSRNLSHRCTYTHQCTGVLFAVLFVIVCNRKELETT